MIWYTFFISNRKVGRYMILYHGSKRDFEEFVIHPSLTERDFEALNEGYGIYMTEDREFASRYGGFLYTVEVDDDLIFNSLHTGEVLQFLKEIENEVGFPILRYINALELIEGVIEGFQEATDLPRSITLELDSSSSFFEQAGDLVTYEEDCLFEKIRKANETLLKPVTRYHNRSLGINYIAKKTEALRLIKKERL